MSSGRTLPGRLPSGVGRWGRRTAQKARTRPTKDPYEPNHLGRHFRLRLTPLWWTPTTGAARTGCCGATNGQPNQQAFHQRSGCNCRYKEEFHRCTSESNRRTVRRCLTITVIFGQPPATCPPAWRPGSARPCRTASRGGWRSGRCRGRGSCGYESAAGGKRKATPERGRNVVLAVQENGVTPLAATPVLERQRGALRSEPAQRYEKFQYETARLPRLRERTPSRLRPRGVILFCPFERGNCLSFCHEGVPIKTP